MLPPSFWGPPQLDSEECGPLSGLAFWIPVLFRPQDANSTVSNLSSGGQQVVAARPLSNQAMQIHFHSRKAVNLLAVIWNEAGHPSIVTRRYSWPPGPALRVSHRGENASWRF
jgi:hypothetical protein